MSKIRFLIIVFTILFLITPVNSAIIRGKVYSWELKPIVAVIEINTTPLQRVVAENGSYSFDVPIGVYEIRAYSYADGFELYCNETVVVKDNGIYTIDLILFPKLETTLDEDMDNITFEIGEEQRMPSTVLANVVLAVFGAGVGFYVYRRKLKAKEVKKVEVKTELPDDLKQILDLLRSLGGRATQKELREKLGWSEAKLSLALADLERKGLIEKYKKGRGNIIFLKELITDS